MIKYFIYILIFFFFFLLGGVFTSIQYENEEKEMSYLDCTVGSYYALKLVDLEENVEYSTHRYEKINKICEMWVKKGNTSQEIEKKYFGKILK